jgi:proline-specific peptidase
MSNATERTVSFRGHQVWTRTVGAAADPTKLPLLCLHGGPGVPHDYLEPIEGVAASGRQVVFYDQLGCGNSDQPHDRSMWTPALFLEEIDVVRAALGLDRIHLLGQSWGGMLAMQYAITQPKGLVSLIVASSPARMDDWEAAADEMRRQLPADVQAALAKHESAGTTDSAEYQAAMTVFYKRHVCRLDPYPPNVQRAFDKVAANPEVYHTMWGPSEFHVTGNLKGWDVSGDLHTIKVPTLVTSGRHDEASPAVVEPIVRGIAGAKQVIFENSSHMSHVEEAELYVRTVGEFLETVEAKLR